MLLIQNVGPIKLLINRFYKIDAERTDCYVLWGRLELIKHNKNIIVVLEQDKKK